MTLTLPKPHIFVVNSYKWEFVFITGEYSQRIIKINVDFSKNERAIKVMRFKLHNRYKNESTQHR